jgi:hypothetical protein
VRKSLNFRPTHPKIPKAKRDPQLLTKNMVQNLPGNKNKKIGRQSVLVLGVITN